jgi:hypothetical protein
MRTLDIASALIMIALSAVTFFATRHLPYWADFAPGSAFGPVWVSLAGVLISLLLIVDAIRRPDNPPIDLPDRPGFIRVALAVAALWSVVYLTPIIGLIATAILFMLFLLLVVERRPLVPSLITTALTIGLVYGVFSVWLEIAFPKGAFGI